MYATIFLLVKATVQTTHKAGQDAVADLQKHSTCTVSDTKEVKIKELKFMDYKLKV